MAFDFGSQFMSSFLNAKKQVQEDEQFKQKMAFEQRQFDLTNLFRQQQLAEQSALKEQAQEFNRYKFETSQSLKEAQTQFKNELEAEKLKNLADYRTGQLELGRERNEASALKAELAKERLFGARAEKEQKSFDTTMSRLEAGISEIQSFKDQIYSGNGGNVIYVNPITKKEEITSLKTAEGVKENLKNRYKKDALTLVNKRGLFPPINAVKGKIKAGMPIETAIDALKEQNDLSDEDAKVIYNYFTLFGL